MKKLCELPEVFDLVNALTMLIDHCGARVPLMVVDKGFNPESWEAYVVRVLTAVGFKAEWREVKVRGKIRRALHVAFPTEAAADRFQKANAKRAKK